MADMADMADMAENEQYVSTIYPTKKRHWEGSMKKYEGLLSVVAECGEIMERFRQIILP